ncbi:MAG: hypothetical protein AAF772_03205, partial [Acidobacteriota bacterium]
GDDARRAASPGAAALGLNFSAASPRCVPASRAWAFAWGVRAAHGDAVAIVAVVDVAIAVDALAAIDAAIAFDRVQLHPMSADARMPDDARRAALAPWSARTIRVAKVPPTGLTSADAASLRALAQDAWGFVLDVQHPSGAGGTGQRWDASSLRRFDPSLVDGAGRVLGRPTFVAGGIRPENVAALIHTVRPWGIDLASGVESSPGHHDPERLARLFAAIAAVSASPGARGVA